MNQVKMRQCCSKVTSMRNNYIAKRVYVGECVSSCLVYRPWKRGIDSVSDCLKKKRALYAEQVRRMVYDRSEWWNLVRRNRAKPLG